MKEQKIPHCRNSYKI